MKKLLVKINVLLGIASMALAGCHSQKAATKTETESADQPKQEEVAEDPKVICMYGVPASLQVQDTTATQQQQEEEPLPPVRPMLKYGVPNPRPMVR